MIVKGRRWPVPMYKFYGVKRLDVSRHSPYRGWDYRPYTRSHGWTPPIWAPSVTFHGYHVHSDITADRYKGDILYLAECVVPTVSTAHDVYHEDMVTCTAIRLVKRLTEEDYPKLNFQPDNMLNRVKVGLSYHTHALSLHYKTESHALQDLYTLPKILQEASDEL